MVQLQGVYNEVANALTKIQTPDADFAGLQETNRQRQQELQELEETMAAQESELANVQKKEEEWRLELAHFQKQKGMVTNEREFTAVISEIDYATKALEEAEQRKNELEESRLALSTEVENRRQARPEEEAAEREITERWNATKDKLKQRVHDLVEQAAAIEADLKPKNSAHFRRLLKSKAGTPMAAVVDGCCSMCHFSLRPHLRQRVRRCEEIIICEHCHRILYLEEVFADAD
jgi:predicted  nucleic acid-binding Zn-ribbon protein